MRAFLPPPTWASTLLIATFLSLLLGAAAAQEVKLLPSDGAADDRFGDTVALSGDGLVALISARDDDNGPDAGAVYAFVRDGASWAEQAKLVPSDGEASDLFGEDAVALNADGTMALIGASWDDDGGSNAGAVYVFVRDGSTWTESAKLVAADAADGDQFGGAVALSGDGAYAAVAASGDDGAGFDAGSVYVLAQSGGVWTEQAKLLSSEAGSGDHLQYAAWVDIDDDGSTVLVSGRRIGATTGRIEGRADVFTRMGTDWAHEALLVPNDGVSLAPPIALSGDGDLALLGAQNAFDRGRAYAFARSGGVWTEEAPLAASDGEQFDSFGFAVALSGDGTRALVGAPGVDEGFPGAGAAYVFARSGGAWVEEVKHTASDAAENDSFGRAVGLGADGRTRLVAATEDDDNGSSSGSAYVIEETAPTASEEPVPTPTVLLSAPAPNPFHDRTRLSVTLAGPDAVRVAVYDVLGRRVAVLHDGPVSGPLDLVWEAGDAAAGLYLVRAEGADARAVRRLLRLR